MKDNLKKALSTQLQNYIDKNAFLLKSDNPYIINIYLKPRLISEATRFACKYCLQKNLIPKQLNEDEWEEVFLFTNTEVIKAFKKYSKLAEK